MSPDIDDLLEVTKAMDTPVCGYVYDHCGQLIEAFIAPLEQISHFCRLYQNMRLQPMFTHLSTLIH